MRVWVERPPGAGLRARISAQRLDDGERTTFAAHTVDAIVDVVRHWLDEFVAESV